MSLKNDVLFLGLGNCGCKQAKVFYEMDIKLCLQMEVNRI